MKSFCVRQIETDLYDGWYFLPKQQEVELLRYWNRLLPEYTHEIVRTGPESIPDSKMLNRTEAYERALGIGPRAGDGIERVGLRVLQQDMDERIFDSARAAGITNKEISRQAAFHNQDRVDAARYILSKRGVRDNSMKKWVRLHKDGDHMGVETNCIDEKEFWTEFSAALAEAIENKFLGQAQEQFQRWLPQAFECVAQLRGYKSDVVIEQIIKSGEVYSGSQEVFTSEKPRLSVVAKEQA